MKFSLIVLFAVLLFSCSTDAIKPKFKTIDHIVVKQLNYTKIVIQADAIVYNPNPVSIYLNEIDIDVFVNNVKVNHILQTQKTIIKKKADFSIPLESSFAPKKIIETNWKDILNGALSSFENKKVTIQYKGTAQFEVKGITFDIAIDEEEEILLKEDKVQ